MSDTPTTPTTPTTGTAATPVSGAATDLVPTAELRARFAVRLADLYSGEVPAYITLVDVSREVNERAMAADPADAQRLGAIDRVTAERHGAIRVGSQRELAQAAQVFAAFGMYPTGFYDLRDAWPQPIPVVSTAFRPHDADELAKNPFRVFTSMLVPQDRRFFTPDLEDRLVAFIDARELFPAELLDLAARAEREGGLPAADAERLLELGAAAFALGEDPVDRQWYDELSAISGVAADIGGITSTHINHLTPRVLDIDDLYASMSARGIEMIDEIQGPPDWEGPDVLLRQTSFRALAEKRDFRDTDGSIREGELRVRFGEVEQRGIALTRRGREVYDDLVALVDRRRADLEAAGTPRTRVEVAREVWREQLPATEAALEASGLGYFTYAPTDQGIARREQGETAPTTLDALLEDGWVTGAPIVYEDFLPRSAAGIFASNLVNDGTRDEDQQAAERDQQWLQEVIGRPVADPFDLYDRQRQASLDACAKALGLAALHPREDAATVEATPDPKEKA